jgi:hypothetical protein
MRPTRPIFIVLAFLVAGSARGEGSEKGTEPLCRASERPVFSCSTGRKTISVCASRDLSASAGNLTYRFGRSRQNVELSYPADKEHPRQHFRFGYSAYAKGCSEQLSFTVGAITYMVFVERSVFDWNGSGVIVKSGDREVARLDCNHDPEPDDLYALKDLGMPAAQIEDVEPAP